MKALERMSEFEKLNLFTNVKNIFEQTNNKSGSAWLINNGYRPIYRVNKCQCWVFGREEEETQYILSYDTLVAIYEPYYDLLVSFGRYTHTTYKHIRKFRNDYSLGGYKCEEINMELVNWFK